MMNQPCSWRTDSPLGGIVLSSDGQAITGLWFEGQAHFPAELARTEHTHVFDEAIRWLEVYFSGKRPDFTPPVALEGTPFRKAVWQALLEIPYGRTATYGGLAKALSEKGFPKASPRAVGGAVARNPISIIVPCHRVLGAGGRLTGYAGGLERKQALLKLEGIL